MSLRPVRPLGSVTVGGFVRAQVLRLSYTAHDLGAFARDMGYDGVPFPWDPEDRRHGMAGWMPLLPPVRTDRQDAA